MKPSGRSTRRSTTAIQPTEPCEDQLRYRIAFAEYLKSSAESLRGEPSCDSGSATGGRAIYWSSPEAAALFGFNYSADDDGVDLLEKVIEKLDNAIEHFIGSLSIPPTQQSKKQFILHQIRPESSGCNRARVLCNI